MAHLDVALVVARRTGSKEPVFGDQRKPALQPIVASALSGCNRGVLLDHVAARIVRLKRG
jgi:hypothetical protein